MKKILVSAYFAKNFGDDLFLKILFERYKNVEWTMNVYDKSYKEIFLKYPNVKIINTFSHKIFRKLKLERLSYNKYDAIVFIGGSIFMEVENWKRTYSQTKKIFRYFDGKPTFITGCNFGPFKSEEFFENYKELFVKSKDICFRDKYSYDLFSSLDNVRLAPDIIFQLKTKNVEKIKNSLGISVIDLKERTELLKYQNLYIEKIVDIIKEAIKREIKVTLFSFCEKQGDIEIIKEIANKIDRQDRNYIFIENYDGDIERFLDKFMTVENVIGTRFHACILSQVFGQGLYPIIYSNKTYNVLKDIDLLDEYTYIKDIENLSEKHVLDTISQNKIQDDKIFLEAEKQFEGLDKYVKY